MVTSAPSEKHGNKGKTSCKIEVSPLFRLVTFTFFLLSLIVILLDMVLRTTFAVGELYVSRSANRRLQFLGGKYRNTLFPRAAFC